MVEDIWRVADMLIKNYGDEAELVAADRADALMDLGDFEGLHVWKRILAGVRFLAHPEPERTLH
jgi:hypothetical protein